MNFSQARVRLVQAGAVLAVAALVAGCGNNYRPVVVPSSPSGPAAQPESFAIAVSATSNKEAAGIATIIDYSGDSVMAYALIGPGPIAFTVDAAGGNGYTINSDGTLTNFPIEATLRSNLVAYTTLPSTAKPVNLFSPASVLWAADLCATTPPSSACESAADVFSGIPETFLLSIPVAPPTPVMVVGPPSTAAQRYYAISQNIPNPTGVECNQSPTIQPDGEVTGIEVLTDSVTQPSIPVGKCPVYAVESRDSSRLFVLNRGSDTITVINAQNDTLDGQYNAQGQCIPFQSQTGQTVTCHPTLPLSTTAVSAMEAADPSYSGPPNGTTGMPVIAGPVYAEYNAATSKLVVADYDGGTISIIDVSEDEYGNDSPTFGTTYTVSVGKNPASVTVLSDGLRAYSANQGDGTGNGTVSIVNLNNDSLETPTPLAVVGHPRTVVSTENSEYGKVYVASPDSPDLTIIRTDLDIVDVRVTSQNGLATGSTGGNYNNVSRAPGYGQPCNLPPALMTSTYGANYTLAQCQALP